MVISTHILLTIYFIYFLKNGKNTSRNTKITNTTLKTLSTIYKALGSISSTAKKKRWPLSAHASNLKAEIKSEGRDQEDCSLRPAKATKVNPISKTPNHIKGLAEWVKG
jgi:hypothetical protein